MLIEHSMTSNKHKGSWSGYNKQVCSLPCGGGYIQYERVCLYPPCDGDKFQTTSEPCNTHSCQDHKLVAKGGTVTKHATEGDEHCVFPFLLHGSTYYSCIEKVLCGSACKNGKQKAPSKYKANSICALSPNLSNDRRWGFCPQDMEGLWTQWTGWKRLKIKDGVIILLKIGSSQTIQNRLLFYPLTGTRMRKYEKT